MPAENDSGSGISKLGKEIEMTTKKNHDLWIKHAVFAVFCLCSALLLSGTHTGTAKAEAAVKRTDILLSRDSTSCTVDLDGDGKKEQVVLKAVYDEQECYFAKTSLLVDGQEALSFGEMGISLVTADYIKMNDANIFLRVFTNTDNDCVVTDRIYRYDPSKKKLTEAARLLDDVCGVIHARPKLTRVTDAKLTITYQMQFDEIGRVQWTADYAPKNGRLELVSNVMKVKSTLGDTAFPGDGYERLFQKNQFRAMQKIRLFGKTDMKHVAVTVKPEDIVTLTKIKYSKKSLYVKFSKGSKAGWMKLGQTEDASRLFYGVASRLAG